MALSEIEKLERRYAENPQGLTFAPLAEVHRKNGDVTRALELLRPGLGLHPDYIPASIVLGRCHLDLGELPAAETAFTHVLALDGENVIALKALADITERQGRFEESERWLRTLLAIDRSNDDARDQLGRVEATRRQTGTSSLVDAPAAALAGDAPTADAAVTAAEPGAPAAEPAGLADLQPADASTLDRPTAEPSTPVMGWMAESGSAEVVDATPLDLEDLDLSRAEPVAKADGIDLEQPVTLPDTVQPIAGLVGRDDHLDVGSFDHVADFRVETAEDIVLNSSGGSEFQMANAAEELLASREPPEPTSVSGLEPTPAGPGRNPETSGLLDEPLPPIAMESEDAVSAETPAGSEATPNEAAGREPPVAEPTLESTSAKTAEDAVTAEAPLPEWVKPSRSSQQVPGEGPAADDWTPPWARSREPEMAAAAEPTLSEHAPETARSEAPPLEPDHPEPASVTAPEPPAPSPAQALEPDLVVTASMGELLFQQGHLVEALTVYRLLDTRASAGRYRGRIAELERLTAPPAPPSAPAPVAERPSSPPAPPIATPSYSIGVTQGESVQTFLQRVLAARPPAVSGSAAVHPAPARPETADPSGAPTRPAHDSLSLSSVFGEETSPSLPAVPAAGAPAAGGVSYDQFFGGGSGAPAAHPARAPDPKSDDLDQFHAWLQNLKR